MYQIEKLFEIQVEKYERHVCVNDCCLFPQRDESEYSILEATSILAERVPSFDIVRGYLIEYFHKLCHVFPTTFWEDDIF